MTSIDSDTLYWIKQTLETRRCGHTYVHAPRRRAAEFPWCAHNDLGVTFSFTGWGRSLQSGGHKYKVHARDSNGHPIPTKVLRKIADRIRPRVEA